MGKQTSAEEKGQDISVSFSPNWSHFWEELLNATQQAYVENFSSLIETFKQPAQEEQGISLFSREIMGYVMRKTAEQLSEKPDLFLKHQQEHLQNINKLGVEIQKFFQGVKPNPIISPCEKDKRFKNPLWREDPFFFFFQQLYLLNVHFIKSLIADLEGLDEATAKKLAFYTQQFVDATAPTNFPLSNPDVVEKIYQTGGENLVKGFQNFIQDRLRGEKIIPMTDKNALELKRDIAKTPGKVVFQNHLFELIQYAPATSTVYEVPLLIIPPWINKFYVFDLKPENSFVKWAVEQGLTVFMISWINPSKEHRNLKLADYILQGGKKAVEVVQETTGAKNIWTLGYCTGGVLLKCLLSYLGQRKKNPVLGATLIAAPTDFKEAGDMLVFICEQQLKILEKHMENKGYLDGETMVQAFNLLRANDLIWSNYVNNYLLGQSPVPFDMLYWNSDPVRLPARMHGEFLKKMYLENKLIIPGGLKVNKTPVDLSAIQIPLFILANQLDHIAPWKSVYPLTYHTKGKNKFVLGGSGHVAGVFNSPQKNRYGFWTSVLDVYPPNGEEWLQHATYQEGSWWGVWLKWLTDLNSKKIPATPVKDYGLGDAPGSYVVMT